MKNNRINISRKMISLLVVGGITLVPMTNALAKTYTEGKFVELNEEEEQTSTYYEYVVKEGDNLSRISEKICHYYGEDITTKYWPALAFLNDFPRVIRPGDVIRFPKTFESLVSLNNTLRKKGWTARYIQNNNIYGNNKKYSISKDIIYSILNDIYGDEFCVDEDFVRTYIDMHDLNGKYELMDTDKYDKEAFFILTEWIPSSEEIITYTSDDVITKSK